MQTCCIVLTVKSTCSHQWQKDTQFIQVRAPQNLHFCNILPCYQFRQNTNFWTFRIKQPTFISGQYWAYSPIVTIWLLLQKSGLTSQTASANPLRVRRSSWKSAVSLSKRNCFERLCEQANVDPWGTAYKICKSKFKNKKKQPKS